MNSDQEFADIRTRLLRLRAHPDYPIKNLSGQDLLDYDALVRYTNMLHNTSLFEKYSNLIKEIFGNLPSIIPGTIGAYFGGCLAQINYSNPICSPICVSSIPAPGQDSCGYKVVLANMTPNGYEFQVLNDVNSDKAIIFTHNFDGFTFDEKNTLQRKGIQYVNISTFSHDGKNYVTPSAAFIELDKVQVRALPLTNGNTICNLTTPVEDTGSFIQIIFLIIVILAAFIKIAAASRY